MGKHKFLIIMGLLLTVVALSWGVDPVRAQLALATPDYFGVPNWANSPLPQINGSGAVIPGTGMRKFVDTLPGLCASGVNNLGQCIPIATPDTGTYPFLGPAADFYRIGLQEYTLQMHSDLPPTNLRGYFDLLAPPGTKQQYLGPLILATRNRPVRILFNNMITTDLNIPVDTTYLGAGVVSDGTNNTWASQKRAAIHLHGGNTPWISDGTPHQWITPATGDGQPNAKGFAKGFSFMNVPDMLSLVPDDLFDGFGTHYWTNQQPGRLMFYHDHAYGITRLNVYAGEAAGYLLVDPNKETQLLAATVPGTIVTNPADGAIVSADLPHVIPLVIQDKTFVPDPAQLAATDPTWDTLLYGGKGNLWFPHVYMPNQNPYDITGANPFGRWDWGPWFWPPQPVLYPAVPCTSIAYPGVPLTCPSTPNPSGTPEAFMDIPVVNGTAFPKFAVDPTAYRFHILNAGNDRALNLGLYLAEPLSVSVTAGGSGYTSPPTVTISGGGGTYTTASATVVGGIVSGITVTGATGYTSAPAISITGGGGTGAAAIASVNTEVKMVPAVSANIRGLTPGGSVGSLTLTSGGGGYTSPPTVTITGGGGSGATATATLGGKPVSSITMTAWGSGYTSQPTVNITGGGGSGAMATANIIAGFVWYITVTNGGSGYTSPPTVTITGGGGTGATAIATLSTSGSSVFGLTLTNGGTGYTSPPTVTITGGGGTGASAIAMLSPGGLPDCTTSNQMNGGGLVLAQDTNGTPINTPTGLPTGCWPTYDSTFFGPLSWPTDLRDGGVPDPTTAGPPIIQIGTEAGLIPKVAVIPSTPISYDYNRRSITVLNVLNHGLFLGPAERADVIIDFSAFAGKTLILYNDAPAPVPASDPRIDYYTNNLDYTSMGGAPPTLAGYGPNTRTIMQIVVNPTIVGPPPTTPFNLATLRTALPTIFALTQDPIIVPETDYPTGNGGAAMNTYARIQDTSVSLFSGGPVGGLTLQNGGSGYTSAPAVNIIGGNGSGATATATLSATGSVFSLTLTSGGSGYTSTPTVTFTGGGGTGAAATATLVGQPVASISVTNGGSGYTSTPTVTIAGGGGSGATAVATFPASGPVGGLTLTNGGSGYTSAPTVNITGGGGSGATATATIGKPIYYITVTNGGAGYTSAPTVTFTGGGGTGATATAYAYYGIVYWIILTNGGSGYTSPPTVTFTGGGGTGATATATLSPYGSVSGLTLTNGGSGYTSAPTVGFTGGGGSGAAATASIGRPITGITLTNGGSGYTSTPTVNFIGGGGSGAAATAILPGPTGIASISVTNGGSGYTSPPTVAITGGGGGSGATATATLAANGPVASLTVTNGGSGYTSAPTVNFTGGGGSGATATATLGGRSVASIAMTAWGSGYTSQPTVNITGGGGSGAMATANIIAGFVWYITVTNGGSGYTSPPTVTITGGGGTGATATATLSASAPVASLTLTNGGSGYTSPPTVTITGGGGSGATATATIGGPVASISVTNPGINYTSPPTVTITGGGGSGATATATLPPPMGIASLTLTNGGSGYTSAPTVGFTGGGGTGAAATATIGMSVASLTLTTGGTGYTSQPAVTFTGGGGSGAYAVATGAVTPLLPKAIHELFTLDYGRMNALLGVELPFTTALIQTTIPYGFIDPPTEVFKDGDTQLWKITHNGVDTHFTHFHLFNVQVINRVGWDGAIKPPDLNELGFKETVRMNPLEDIIVALRPLKQNLPWDLPNSHRPMDVTMPLGTTAQFLNVDPTNQPAVVTNSSINFAWEYVWHCHILGHEENDMMRPMVMSVAPAVAPSSLTATVLAGPQVQLTWTDNSINENEFIIQKSTDGGTTWVDITVPSPSETGTGSMVTYTDTTVSGGTTYTYRVIARNRAGYIQTYAPPAIGYPTTFADSAPSSTATAAP